MIHRCTPVCMRPTLGAYLRKPDVAARRAAVETAARERTRAGLAESTARINAAQRLLGHIDDLYGRRRVDAVARDLRALAADLERLPPQLLAIAMDHAAGNRAA